MEQILIHMTAAFSNAVLVAILPHVSDFAKRLELPIPLPITANQIKEFKPHPFTNFIGGVLTLTNGDRFFEGGHGYVNIFYGYKNYNMPPEDLDWDNREQWASQFYGQMNMTTNEVIEFARDALRKLGYQPKTLHADMPPTQFNGPWVHGTNTIPFCDVEWSPEDGNDIIFISINAEKKQIVCFSLVSTNAWRAPPKLDVVPELESDYQKRLKGKMFIRTNAPVRFPRL